MKKSLIYKVILSTDTNSNNNFELLLSAFQSQLSQMVSPYSKPKVVIQGVILVEKTPSPSTLSSDELSLLPSLTKSVSDMNSALVDLANTLQKPRDETFLKVFFTHLERMKVKLSTFSTTQVDFTPLLSSLCDNVEENMDNQISVLTLIENQIKLITFKDLTKETLSSKGFDGIIVLNNNLADLQLLIDNRKVNSKQKNGEDFSTNVSKSDSINKVSRNAKMVKKVAPSVHSESLPLDVKQQFDALLQS